MLREKLTNIPTNLIMGFLGVGKTTAILDLLRHKPKNENWAVLVNEFGKVGIDGAIFAAFGATVREVAGGCLCCAVGLPFQASINRLLKETRPDRLLIEPTGLGHPKKVLEMLGNEPFKRVLDVRASICLVDPQKLKDHRYTRHENFIDQLALSDVLVANKMDLADSDAIGLFHRRAAKSSPAKAVVAETILGRLDIHWLDVTRNPLRRAIFPDAHHFTEIPGSEKPDRHLSTTVDGYQSFGCIFPSENRFEYGQLTTLLSSLDVERIKGVLCTDRGWFIFNSSNGILTETACPPSDNSRIEFISRQNHLSDISRALHRCKL